MFSKVHFADVTGDRFDLAGCPIAVGTLHRVSDLAQLSCLYCKGRELTLAGAPSHAGSTSWRASSLSS
jgi:hypothetical protein